MKVLFLDSWTNGVHNFSPLAAELRDRGVDSLLVHRGSWGLDPHRPDEEVLQGVTCRDIRTYPFGFHYEVLRQERPDAVLILTTTNFADRSAILACRARNTPVLFLMHGLLELPEDMDSEETAAEAKQVRRLLPRRVGKYLRHTVPDYIYSGLHDDRMYLLRKEPYRAFLRTLRNPALALRRPGPSAELHCDRALVWANVYARVLIEDVGYPSDRIHVVGHPPLDPVFRVVNSPPTERERLAFRRELGIPADVPYVVYLEGNFVRIVDGWSESFFTQDVQDLRDATKSAGMHLVIKLHPSSRVAEMVSGIDGVTILSQAPLPMLLEGAVAVIGHVSTTNVAAVCLGKPLLVPRWGAHLALPDDFVRRGLGVAMRSAQEIGRALASPREIARDVAALERYIREFVTFTDGRAVERVCDHLCELAEVHAKRSC